MASGSRKVDNKFKIMNTPSSLVKEMLKFAPFVARAVSAVRLTSKLSGRNLAVATGLAVLAFGSTRTCRREESQHRCGDSCGDPQLHGWYRLLG